MTSLRTSKAGIDLIKHYEGLKLAAYLCPAGVPTIGYGSTRLNGGPVTLGTTITIEEAELALQNDLIFFEKGIKKYVVVQLTQHQFDALVSFAYNLGLGNLKSSTLLKKINANLFQDAAEEFMRWNKAGGKVLLGLTRRREAEKNLFTS